MRPRVFAVVVLLSAAAMTAAGATITQGTFNFAGDIYVTGVITDSNLTIPGVGTCNVGEECIFWQDDSEPPTNDKVNIFLAGLPNGDIPAAIAGSDAANIGSMTNPPEVVGAVFPPEFFMSFNNAGITTRLLLNFIAAGIDGAAGCSTLPPAAGQVCTPPGSPFNLQNCSLSSACALWSFSGVTNDSSSTWSGTFTAAIVNFNYQQELAELAVNGFVQDTFAAWITLVTPEPGAPAAVGMGLMLMLWRRRPRFPAS